MAVLHQPPGAGAGQGDRRGPHRRVRRARLGRRRRPRPAGPRDLHALEARLVGAVGGAARAAARRPPVAAGAAPGAPRPGRPRPDRGHRSSGTTPTAGWSCTAAVLRVVVNLAEDPREIDLDRTVAEVLFSTDELPDVDGATVTLRRRARPSSAPADVRRLSPLRGSGRRRARRGLPAAVGPFAAGELRRLPGRRGGGGGAQRGLGSPGDRRVFRVLRALADVVLVGARHRGRRGLPAGGGRLPRRPAARRLGRPATAPIAVVSRRASLDPASGLVTDAVPHDHGHLRIRRRRPACGAGRGGRRSWSAATTTSIWRSRSTGSRSWASSRCCARAAPPAARRPGRRRRGRAGPVDLAVARRHRPPAAGRPAGVVRSELRQVLEEDGTLFARYRVAGAR